MAENSSKCWLSRFNDIHNCYQEKYTNVLFLSSDKKTKSYADILFLGTLGPPVVGDVIQGMDSLKG